MRIPANAAMLAGTITVCGVAAAQVSVSDDCNGNGIRDVEETGPSNAIWTGPTTGGTFATASNWTYFGRPAGRPGVNTTASFPLSTGTSATNPTLWFDCSNAVSVFTFSDGGRAGSRLTLEMDGRALVVTNSNLAVNATGSSTSAMSSVLVNEGLITVSTSDPKSLVFTKSGTGNAGWWLRRSEVSAPSVTYGSLVLENTTVTAGGFGGSASSALDLRGATLDLRQTSSMSVQAGQSMRASEGASTITLGAGSSPFVALLSGSTASVQADLLTNAFLFLYGKIDVWGQNLPTGGAGQLRSTAASVAVAPDSTASLRLHLDLSDPRTAVTALSASATVSLRGQLQLVHDGTASPVTGVEIPIASGASVTGAFGSVRIVPEPAENVFPAIRYTSTSAWASLVRGSGLRAGTPVTTSAAYAFTKICTLQGVGSSPLVAGLVPGADSSQLVILRRQSSGSLSFVRSNAVLANAVDVVPVDLDGDGSQELVVSFGVSGRVQAFRISGGSGASTLLWTFVAATGATCNGVAVYAPASAVGGGAQLMPTGAKVLVGTDKSSSGSVVVLDGATGTPESETPTGDASARIVRGTDIDDDDDLDVVSSGGTATSFVAGETAVTTLIRGADGRFTSSGRVLVPGRVTDLEVADINGDGRGDVVAALDNVVGTPGTTSRPNVSVLLSQGTTLASPMPVDLGNPSDGGTGIALLDGDGDGDLDVVTSYLHYDNPDRSPMGATVAFPLQVSGGTIAVGRKVTLSSNPARWIAADGRGILILEELASGSATTRQIQSVSLSTSIAPGDMDNSGTVDSGDIGTLLLQFGPCPATGLCTGDLDGSGEIDAGDIGSLLLLFS